MTPIIPIIVPTFNNPTYLRSMLNQLHTMQFANVIVIDSASTTPDMLLLLETLKNQIEIVRLPQNYGPKYFSQNEIFYKKLPGYFCVTDPDLTFNKRLPSTFLEELMEITKKFEKGKAGFALDISDSNEMRADLIQFEGKNYHIWEWEAQFWSRQIGETSDYNPIYEAPIDTTFALYNKTFFDPHRSNDAIRVAGRYTCKHLPWYVENGLPEAEELAYRQSQQNSWYFGGPKILPEKLTLKERLVRNRLLIERYGARLWLGEKITRWFGMPERSKQIQEEMKLIDRM